MHKKKISALLALILIASITLAPTQVIRAAAPAVASGDCRFGIDISQFDFVRALIPHESVARYDIPAMGFGYYLDWGINRNPAVPAHIKYLHVIRTREPDFSANKLKLPNLVQNNPGDVWVVGNEPDQPNEDGNTAEEYADRYFAYATIIRANDPTAKITFGTVTSVTPARLRYFDYAWLEMVKLAGSQVEAAKLIDIISPHAYILNEGVNEWGVLIPPAINTTVENEYISLAVKVTDFHDIYSNTIFNQRMTAMRQWMKDNGLQNKQLWVTEFGNLLPPYSDTGYQIATYAETSAFMINAYNWMYTQKDTNLGKLDDDGHWFQKFFWFSLNDLVSHFGGTLVDPLTLLDTPVGTAYKNYDPPGTPPAPELIPIAVTVVPIVRNSQDHTRVDYNLTARVRNNLISDFTVPATISLYEGANLLGSTSTRVARCGGDGLLKVRVNGFAPNTAHTLTVKVQVAGQSGTTELPFALSGAQFPLPHEAFMPTLHK